MITYTLTPEARVGDVDLEVFAETIQVRSGTIVGVPLAPDYKLAVKLHPEDTVAGMRDALEDVVGTHFVSTNPLALLSGAEFRGGVWVAPTKEEARLWRWEILTRDSDAIICHFSREEAEAFKPIARFAGATFRELIPHGRRFYSRYTRGSLGQVFLQSLADEMDTSAKTVIPGKIAGAVQLFFFAYARAVYAQYPDRYNIDTLIQAPALVTPTGVEFRHFRVDLEIGSRGMTREVDSFREGYNLRLALSGENVPSIMLRFRGQIYVMWETANIDVGTIPTQPLPDDVEPMVLYGFRSGRGLLGVV